MELILNFYSEAQTEQKMQFVEVSDIYIVKSKMKFWFLVNQLDL